MTLFDPPITNFSPLEVSILAHYAGCCRDFRDGDLTAPAITLALIKFKRLDLIEETPPEQRDNGWGIWRGTDKLCAYMRMMGAVPLPTQVWLDPRNRKEV